MAAMAGHVNDFFVAGDFVQALHVIQFDAVVDAIPQPFQKSLNDADRRVGNIGRNFQRVFLRLVPRHFLLAKVVARLGQDRLPNPGVRNTWLISVRRCDRSGPTVATRRWRKWTRRMRETLRYAMPGSCPSSVDGAQRQRMTETQQRIAPEQQRRKEFPRATDDIPVFREQQLDQRAFLLGRPSPVYCDRNQQQLLVALFGGFDQALQPLRSGLARTPYEEPLHAPQDDDTAILVGAAKRQRFRRRG